MKMVDCAGTGILIGSAIGPSWRWIPDGSALKPQLTLTRSRLPTLLVRGGLSDVLSQAGADEFLATCPHAEYVNVTDAAHMVAGDRNDIFTRLLLNQAGLHKSFRSVDLLLIPFKKSG